MRVLCVTRRHLCGVRCVYVCFFYVRYSPTARSTRSVSVERYGNPLYIESLIYDRHIYRHALSQRNIIDTSVISNRLSLVSDRLRHQSCFRDISFVECCLSEIALELDRAEIDISQFARPRCVYTSMRIVSRVCASTSIKILHSSR